MSRKQLAAVLVAVAAVLVVLSQILGGDGAQPTVTVQPRAGAPEVTAPAAAVKQIADSPDPHINLGAENGATPKVLEQDNATASPLAPKINGPVPLASAHQAGCLTRAIPANYSYRTGVRPALVVLHYTVSPNHAGWSDVNGIVAFFSRSATQASSNYVIDNEGHCVLMVPESEKAWAQAGFNSATACSIEVINTGSEGTYIGPIGGAGQRQLARVVHDCAARWHIPFRRGAVSGCAVTRSGVVDHATLGGCGGGHTDIGRFRGADVPRTIANAGRASGAQAKAITAPQRERCGELNGLRADAKKRGWHSPQLERANAIKAGETKNHLRCLYPPKPHRVELIRG